MISLKAVSARTRSRTWSYGSLIIIIFNNKLFLIKNIIFYIYNSDTRETTFLSLETGFPKLKRAYTVLPTCLYEFMPSLILLWQKLSTSTGKKNAFL